jgi:hypothetical protein
VVEEEQSSGREEFQLRRALRSHDRRLQVGVRCPLRDPLGSETVVFKRESVLVKPQGVESHQASSKVLYSPSLRQVCIDSVRQLSIKLLSAEATRSQALQSECRMLMTWAEHHLTSLSAVHIKGSLNCQADQLSRQVLNPKVFFPDNRQVGSSRVGLDVHKTEQEGP